MNTRQLIQYLGYHNDRFYKLQKLGIIPKPKTGFFARKHYSPEEVAEIVEKLLAGGEKLKLAM